MYIRFRERGQEGKRENDQNRVGRIKYTTCLTFPNFRWFIFFSLHQRCWPELTINNIFMFSTDWIALSLNTKSLERVQLQSSRNKILSSIKGILRLRIFFSKDWTKEAMETHGHRDTFLLSPQPSAKGFVIFYALRLCETSYFYLTQVLSKRYIVLHPGQKTLC